jgi:hypothetical protein
MPFDCRAVHKDSREKTSVVHNPFLDGVGDKRRSGTHHIFLDVVSRRGADADTYSLMIAVFGPGCYAEGKGVRKRRRRATHIICRQLNFGNGLPCVDGW